MTAIEFGDKVHCAIHGHQAVLICIGHPHYAPDGDVVVLADENAWGMPINVKWCSVISKGEISKAAAYRGRYIDKFANFLTPQ